MNLAASFASCAELSVTVVATVEKWSATHNPRPLPWNVNDDASNLISTTTTNSTNIADRPQITRGSLFQLLYAAST